MAASTVPPVWKDPLIWFVLGVIFVSSSIMNYLPVTFPVFRRVFGVNLEQMGRIQVCYYGSAVVYTLGGGWWVGRVGYGRAMAIAFVVIAASLSVIGSAPSYTVVLVGAFCFGLGVLCLAVTTASIIGEHFGPIRQQLFFVHAISSSLGSIAGPAALGWSLANVERFGMSWGTAYFVTALMVGSLFVWPSLMRSKILSVRSRDDVEMKHRALAEFKYILSQPAMYMIILVTTLHGMVAAGMLSFVGQLYQGRLGIDAARAAYLLSSMAGGVLAGRALLSLITGRWKLPELMILSACAAGAALFFGATIISTSYLWGLVFFFVAGAFVSGNGPSINSYLGMRYQAYAKTSYTLMSGISYIGGALGPYLVGYLGAEHGLEKSLWMGPLLSLFLSSMALLWFWSDRSKSSPPK